VAADLGHPIGTELIARLLGARKDARTIARARLALERLAVRLSLEDQSRFTSFRHRLEILNKDHELTVIDELLSAPRGLIWGYAVAEEAGRVLVLLQEMESYDP
jgi:hypothetical protein